MIDFTAFDFETANSFRGSPCSVGLVKVRDGKIVDEQHWLMRPPQGVDTFDLFNVALHGISKDTVSSAPYWRDVVADAIDYMGEDIVVAHNAAFDTGVIRFACAHEGIEWPELDFLCTLVLARRGFDLPSYSLPYVAHECGLEMSNHHEALADARAAATILKHLAHQADDADSLPEVAKFYDVGIGHMAAGVYRGCTRTSCDGRSIPLVAAPANLTADPEGYLYGRTVVFTGALKSMTRQMAWDAVVRVGGIPEKATTRRTNVLVVGGLYPGSLRPGTTVSAKAQRAFDLRDKGQDIELMTEADFLQVLDGASIGDIDFLAPAQLTGNNRSLRVDSSDSSSPTRGMRPEQNDRPPRPLQKVAQKTDQPCSIAGCGETAAFRTRKKPTWCLRHIDEALAKGGLVPLEPFTHPQSWRLTECISCGCVAHYRFEYTIDKNEYGEPTCRACWWRKWAAEARALQGNLEMFEEVSEAEAAQHAEDHGYEYLGTLTRPSLPCDPHRVQCRRCGLIRAARLGDISFGCDCSRA